MIEARCVQAIDHEFLVLGFECSGRWFLNSGIRRERDETGGRIPKCKGSQQ